jgi:diphosphomevalonate decarboxylase
MSSVTVVTHANIALIKYWGKRDQLLHLPTKSSLSVGLDALATQTTIERTSLPTDQVFINGAPAAANAAQPIMTFLTLFKQMYGITSTLSISSINNFPTAAGLASSASGFSALALGLDRLFNLGLTSAQLSILARRGSGSACRSCFGGFVIWHQGQAADGHDSVAEQLFPAEHWPELRIIVVLVSATPKAVSSRVAMQRSATTSAHYAQWLEESRERLQHMHGALAAKDLAAIGCLAEADCLGMHKTMHTSQPPINFWSATTAAVMQAIIDLRAKDGVTCYFTIDAGPNVKILCHAAAVATILTPLNTIPGVIRCITSAVAHEPTVTLKRNNRHANH